MIVQIEIDEYSYGGGLKVQSPWINIKDRQCVLDQIREYFLGACLKKSDPLTAE
ncbi:MAG: hypothetical protein KQI81_02355 [Deltaproteobacteria bacterium]|nr:hypothetical protein [Deltaproteobacteria bacterium]